MKWKKSITDFQFFLKIERGLSQNTIDSYSRDLKKLSLFLEENNITDIKIYKNIQSIVSS